MKKDKEEMVRTSLRLPKSLVKWLQARSDAEGSNLSVFIRRKLCRMKSRSRK